MRLCRLKVKGQLDVYSRIKLDLMNTVGVRRGPLLGEITWAWSHITPSTFSLKGWQFQTFFWSLYVGFIQYTQVEGGRHWCCGPSIYIYMLFVFLFLTLFWGGEWPFQMSWTFSSLCTSSSQPVLVGKETLYRKDSVAGFSQEVGKGKLCCSNSLAISLVGQDVLNISVLRAWCLQ